MSIEKFKPREVKKSIFCISWSFCYNKIKSCHWKIDPETLQACGTAFGKAKHTLAMVIWTPEVKIAPRNHFTLANDSLIVAKWILKAKKIFGSPFTLAKWILTIAKMTSIDLSVSAIHFAKAKAWVSMVTANLRSDYEL